MSRWTLLGLRLLVGGIFAVAGAVKITDPAGFAVEAANYRLLPGALVNLMAITLPWIEVLAGGLLVIGVWRRASAAVIAVLMAAFIVAITSALARGLDVRCGCFGKLSARPAGLKTLAQDGALFLAAAWVWRRSEN
jgi:uncharacterized membrane protein YphA (DoxX/SURF4 family)